MKPKKTDNEFDLEEVTILEKHNQVNSPVQLPITTDNNFDDETTRLEPAGDTRTWFQKFKEWLGEK